MKHADFYAVTAQRIAVAAVAIAVEVRLSPYQTFRAVLEQVVTNKPVARR